MRPASARDTIWRITFATNEGRPKPPSTAVGFEAPREFGAAIGQALNAEAAAAAEEKKEEKKEEEEEIDMGGGMDMFGGDGGGGGGDY